MRTILAILLLTTIAHAQATTPPAPTTTVTDDADTPCAPTVPEDQRRAMLARNGVNGIWFHGDVARCMLTRLTLLPEYARQIHLLEQRLQLADDRDHLRQQEVDLSARQATTATNALDAAVRQQAAAEAERDAWWRSPWLWLIIGGVLVGAIFAVAAYAIHSI